MSKLFTAKTLCAGISALLLSACGEKMQAVQISAEPAAAVRDAANQEVFTEIAGETGLNFRHFIGASGTYFFAEQLGSGAALFDYDGDGDLDIYLVQGAMLGDKDIEASIFPVPPIHFPGNRLFENRLIPEGRLTFIDVTGKAGVGDDGYGMGVAVADIDNDGHQDLFVSNFGADVLYRNNGDGSFADITPKSFGNSSAWSTSASFFDLDGDRLQDLFVANYVNYSIYSDKRCDNLQGVRIYCAPDTYPPAVDYLFLNEDGLFRDVSAIQGLDRSFGAGLGVVSADFNGDGHADVYVANDGDANQLWTGDGLGKLAETALMAGAAYNVDGKTEASMGVTAGDFDGDGDEDLFMTHFDNETNTLYVNDGQGNFRDSTAGFDLGAVSLPFTGFGAGWFDVDNDGRLDLLIANGAVVAQGEQIGVSDYPFAETNQLFVQDADGHFTDVSMTSGDAMALKEVSRGAAFGDIDNDGDVDVLITNSNGPVRLLRNDIGNRRPWLSVRLVGVQSNRDGAGARLALMRDGHKMLWRRAHTDGSYLSASDIRVHFGLGDEPRIDAVGVIWPSGQREQWKGVEANRFVTLTEGSGEPWPR